MNSRFLKKHNLKAFGLVEVLIALVFVASSMIVALNTVSRALKISKDNEIKDKAMGVMLSGLEYGNAEKQLGLPIDDVANFIGTKCFKLNAANIDGKTGETLKSGSAVLDEEVCGNEIDTPPICPENYKINVPGMDICNQIIISSTNITGTGEMADKIRITSIVTYYIDGEIMTEKAHAFRDKKSITVTP